MIRLLHIFVFSFTLLAASSAFAQLGGDGPIIDLGGGVGGGVDNGGGIIDGGGAAGGAGGAGGGGGAGAGALPNTVGDMIADDRTQGFVGPTASAIESGAVGEPGGSPGFIGPSSESIEANSGSPQVQGNGGANGGGLGGLGGLGGIGGTMNGFQITRSSVRARVVPNFSFNQVSGETVSRGFEQRLRRLPNVGEAASGGIQVQVQGTTALISGVAANQQAIDDVMGQLRMEPGVYRIINDVKIENANNQNGSPVGLSSNN